MNASLNLARTIRSSAMQSTHFTFYLETDRHGSGELAISE